MLKKLLKPSALVAVAIFFLACAGAWGQAQPPAMYDPKLISFVGTPSGSCTIDLVSLNTTNGAFYSCNPFTHTWVGAQAAALPISITQGGFTHTLTGSLTAPRTWTLQDASDTFVFRSTPDTLANKSFSTAPLPSSAGGVALGSAALPFSNLFFGPSASASFNFGGTPTTQRTITWPDASDTVVELGATQALTNKTFDISANTLKTATNTAGHVPRNNGTQYVDGQLAASDLSNGTTGSGNVVLATSPAITTPTIDGFAKGHVASQVSATTNFGVALTSQTVISSMPATGNVSLVSVAKRQF